jgi:hypothetical protein
MAAPFDPDDFTPKELKSLIRTVTSWREMESNLPMKKLLSKIVLMLLTQSHLLSENPEVMDISRRSHGKNVGQGSLIKTLRRK